MDDLQPGKEILSYCLKCKLNLAHTIVSLVDEVVAKVTCKTCGSGPKKFRPPKDLTKKPATRKKRSSKKDVVKTTDEDIKNWQQKNIAKREAPPTPYALDALYEVDGCIEHPKFGVGFVDKLINNKRMEVLFEEGRKLLVMNYQK